MKSLKESILSSTNTGKGSIMAKQIEEWIEKKLNFYFNDVWGIPTITATTLSSGKFVIDIKGNSRYNDMNLSIYDEDMKKFGSKISKINFNDRPIRCISYVNINFKDFKNEIIDDDGAKTITLYDCNIDCIDYMPKNVNLVLRSDCKEIKNINAYKCVIWNSNLSLKNINGLTTYKLSILDTQFECKDRYYLEGKRIFLTDDAVKELEDFKKRNNIIGSIIIEHDKNEKYKILYFVNGTVDYIKSRKKWEVVRINKSRIEY